MKSKLSYLCPVTAPGLLLGFALLTAGLASAQNFVKNPDFEEPLGPDNWTVVYTGVINSSGAVPNNSGPGDFLVAGRSTMAHKDMVPGSWDGHDGQLNDWSKFGGHFAPNHTWKMHAYFKQVVTNLTPVTQYAVSVWMTQFGAHLDAAQVYMQVLGGVAGNVSKQTPYVTDNAQNNPAGWKKYTVTNTASSSGRLEIQLHYNKISSVGDADSNYWEYRNQNAFYDHVSVMPVGQTEYLPPYKVVSLVRTNQDITLTWQTVMNNRYRVQYSTNLSGSMAWLERDKNVDTNFFALGTNFTFKTNLLAYNASFDTNAPLFFRIHSTSFKP